MGAGHGYLIRRAGSGDHEAVTREFLAYLSSLGLTCEAATLDRDIAGWQEEYAGSRGALLVLVGPQSVVVGTSGVRKLSPEICELKRMWIRPESRGLGLGARLLAASEAEARALGCRCLRLDSQRRLDGALRLYRTHGYSEIGDYNQNPRADIWMGKRL